MAPVRRYGDPSDIPSPSEPSKQREYAAENDGDSPGSTPAGGSLLPPT